MQNHFSKFQCGQKGISSLDGIIIIIVIAIIAFGGVFAYQYFMTKTSNQPQVQNQQQNQNQNQQTAQPSITVTSPNGGEQWAEGSTHNITWNSTGLSGTFVSIVASDSAHLVNGIGITAYTVANNVLTSSGSYLWTIPSTITPSNEFKIAITNDGGMSGIYTQDASDNYFSIVAPTNQTAGWKTYTDTSLEISVKYPPSWTYQKFSCNLDGVAFCPLAGHSPLNCGQTCSMNSPESPIYLYTNGANSNLTLNSTNNDYKAIYNEMLSTFVK